jgi:hypothetical protein
MIADNQVLFSARQPVEHLPQPLFVQLFVAKGEIPEQPQLVFRAHPLMHVPQDHFIGFVRILERSIAEFHNGIMTKVRICTVPFSLV